MFDQLSQRLQQTIKNLTGRGRLTEENIQEALREVRVALLEADVALPVVKEFIEHVRTEALGQNVMQSLTPGQALIKIVHDELIKLMGEAQEELNWRVDPPAIMLLAGLQGSGKTTTTAKLARLLQERHKKKVMVVSTDIYRPAAIKQLETLAQNLGLMFSPSETNENPVDIVQRAVDQAKRQQADILLVDTAGRLHVDKEMMDEIKTLHAAINPIETLFVVDSMTGQDAANTAKAFNDALPLTGVILTKIDGDARGGAALSIRHITGKPIKYVGTGEKTDALEAFHPDRMASRILGMGDVLSLIEEVEQRVDRAKAEKVAKKIKKGLGFDLEDFLEQMEQMGKMGGIASLVSKLPGLPGVSPEMLKNQMHDKKFIQMKAIIQSMTRKERHFPDTINSSRKQRIAKGAGAEIQDVNRLLKQFLIMQKMMKKFSKKGGMKNMMRQMQGMMPPGGFGSGGGFPPFG